MDGDDDASKRGGSRLLPPSVLGVEARRSRGNWLFGVFKKAYSDPNAAYSVSLDMRAAAERYVALSDAGDPVWAPHSDGTPRSVAALAIIGATQMHPVMLAALEKFDRRESERLFRLLEVIAVRYQLVARGRPGRIESLCGRVAKAISDGKIITASAAFTELRELYINDTAFETEFNVKTERESKKAAYLLRGLEHQAHVKAQDIHHKELVPNAVTVEHILPKSPGSAWSKELAADPELHTDYLHRIGNLCLLSDANRALGNKSFSEKKAVFAQSNIRTTSSVSQYLNWGRAEIEQRQSHLAKLAVAEWRFQ